MIDISRSAFPPLPAGHTLLAILPFYHIYGAANILNGSLSVGVPTVIQTRFEPVEFCANIEKYKVSRSPVILLVS